MPKHHVVLLAGTALLVLLVALGLFCPALALPYTGRPDFPRLGAASLLAALGTAVGVVVTRPPAR